jgi:putative Ca2+/H+ antiporter (TMEM165/GDT1 family)
MYVVYKDYEVLFRGLTTFALVEWGQKSNIVGVES